MANIILPTGLLIDRSMERVVNGLRNGAAISKNVLTGDWYASDFTCGPAQDVDAYTAHFGPYATKAAARFQLDSDELEYLDDNGTDGVSTWLVLP